MKQYLDTLQKVYDSANDHPDRTGVGRRSIFSTQEAYDLADGFPLVTTRKVATGQLVKELIMFIRGGSVIEENPDYPVVSFWDRWKVKQSDIDAFVEKQRKLLGTQPFSDKDGNPLAQEQTDGIIDSALSVIRAEAQEKLNSIGPMYGHVWRNAPVQGHAIRPFRRLDQLPSDKLGKWRKQFDEVCFMAQRQEKDGEFELYANEQYNQSIDQLNELIINLKERPGSSRHRVTAWIPEFIPHEGISPQEAVLSGFGCLSPCHVCFQAFVRPAADGVGRPKLDLMMYIASSDVPIGRPYNIAQYAMLLSMIAQVVDMEPGVFTMNSGDTHIYTNQMEINGVAEGVETQLQREPLPLPKLWLNPEIKDLFAFTEKDIEIRDYQYHPAINYPVAV